MAYLQRDEQETLYRYDPIDGVWYLYSTYPPHIKKINKQVENCKTTEDEEGKIIVIEGEVLPGKVRLYK